MAKRRRTVSKKPAAKRARTIKAPDFIMPLIAVIIIAIIAAGVFVLSAAPKPAGQFTAIVSACEESDNGLDAEVHGTTLGTGLKSIISATDYCRSEKILAEYWCDGSEMKSAPIECAGSCVEGLCVTAVSE